MLIPLIFGIQTFAGEITPAQRAVVIGIDTYNPKNDNLRFQNLDGCVNDARSVRDLLISRYQFTASMIDTLYDNRATRDNILESFDKLLNQSNPGDIVVIYYAGHGSQVRNSLSKEADKLDESMVPGDSYLGAKDIRDKELAKKFNLFADKGIKLTVILDCCHSGSLGRGYDKEKPAKVRRALPDLSYDAMDPSDVTLPEDRGVLIMSACQDFECASEQADKNHTPHGAFTIALLQSLGSLNPSSSANDIIASVRAILKFYENKQEPVLAGTDERKKETIFGIAKGALSGKTLIAVLNIKKDSVYLQGGLTTGIYKNSELIDKKVTPPVKVRVASVYGINRCTASVIEGDVKKINPGDLFELTNWCLPEGSMLKVYLSPSDLTIGQIEKFGKSFARLADNSKFTWITDPVKNAPTHTMFYSSGKWFMGKPDGNITDLGAMPENKDIIKNLSDGAGLYVSLPPPGKLVSMLNERYKNDNTVESVPNAREAQYYLTGRYVNEKLEYAFFIPRISEKDTAFQTTMPLRTNYFKLENSDTSFSLTTDSLAEFSLRLAKIKAWLTVSGPPDEGTFPFHLGIKNFSTNKLVSRNEDVKVGDIMGLVFESDMSGLNKWDHILKYIYVFSIDCKGDMNLLFPLRGSVENRFPAMDSLARPYKESYLPCVSFKIL